MRDLLTSAGGRSRRSLFVSLAALLSAIAALAVLGLAGSASANNDPHRTYLAAAPFDLPAAFCGFPVHFEFPMNQEYAKISTGSDGSTILKTTGSLFINLTNTVTGKTITVNASGPGTQTFSPDGTTATFEGTGLFLLFALNGTQSGFPSNMVLTSGLANLTIDLATFTITSMPRQPHVLLDVCAALS